MIFYDKNFKLTKKKLLIIVFVDYLLILKTENGTVVEDISPENISHDL